MTGWVAVQHMALRAGLAALVVLAGQLTGGFEHWTHESLRQDHAARRALKAPAVTLQDHQARSFSPWAGSEGGPRVLIVDFIYTRCATVCQSLGSTFAQLQARLAERGEEARGIELLSISFDPGHDSLPELARYARMHRADPGRWRVARAGSDVETQQLLRALGVVVIADGMGGYTHNAALHLMDRHGRVLALYSLADRDAALAHAASLAREEQP